MKQIPLLPKFTSALRQTAWRQQQIPLSSSPFPSAADSPRAHGLPASRCAPAASWRPRPPTPTLRWSSRLACRPARCGAASGACWTACAPACSGRWPPPPPSWPSAARCGRARRAGAGSGGIRDGEGGGRHCLPGGPHDTPVPQPFPARDIPRWPWREL